MHINVIGEILKSVNVFRQTPLESLRLNIQAAAKRPIRKMPMLAKGADIAAMTTRRRGRSTTWPEQLPL